MPAAITAARILAEHELVRASIDSGALPFGVGVAILLDNWGYPAPLIAKKKYGSDSGGPGDHGIPEIGQAEAAFYSALTGGQKDAYGDLKQIVTELYERGMTWDGIDPFEVGDTVDEWKWKAIASLAAHPMQAFLLGQYLATEATQGKTMRPLSSEDRNAITYLEHQTFSELHDSFEDLKSSLRHALIEGMQQGANPIAVAQALEQELDDHTTHWETIAITETSRAENQGRLQEYLDRGYTYVVGSSAHDSRTCQWCRDNVDGQKFKISEIIGRTNYGRKIADRIPGVLPSHPRCRCLTLPVWDD